MKVTSHFVAVSLKKEFFVALFVDVQAYLKEHCALSCVEFQNLLSLHVTLYYFPHDLEFINLKRIKAQISSLRENENFKITVSDMGGFQRAGQDRLFYLVPTQFQELNILNQKFREDFPNDLLDNHHEFVPHISFLKIIDLELFAYHKDEILKIIHNHLSLINEQNIFEDYNLYAVNSKFSPQIQLKIF